MIPDKISLQTTTPISPFFDIWVAETFPKGESMDIILTPKLEIDWSGQNKSTTERAKSPVACCYIPNRELLHH